MDTKHLKEISALQKESIDEYRESLFRYGLTVISAELATMGFLLQNGTTRHILKTGPNLTYVTISLISIFISLVLLVFYKRLLTMYFSKGASNSLNLLALKEPSIPTNTTDQDKKKIILDSTRKMGFYAKLLPKVLLLSEITLGMGLLFFLIFGISLLNSL